MSSSSLIWTDVDYLPKTYNWAYGCFTLTDSDTTIEYHVTELTSQTFVFLLKTLELTMIQQIYCL